MAEITAALVKDLREKSGAGMMDCKKALTETEWRPRCRDRLAAQEGPVCRREEVRPRRRRGPDRRRQRAAGRRHGRGQCRDRFRRPQRDLPGFRRKRWPRSRSSAGEDVEAIKAAAFPGTGHSVAEQLTQLVATIGENMTIRRARVLRVQSGVVATYVHNALKPGLGKIGVLVALEAPSEIDGLESAGPPGRHACRG